MSDKQFSNEEIELLKQNPYVVKVSNGIVSFSAEFKAKFWAEYTTGKTPKEIIESIGIDPNMLGKTRISGIKATIKKQAKEGTGFKDCTMLPPVNATAEQRIKCLEHQLQYKDQEIEFLKKIVSLYPDGKDI